MSFNISTSEFFRILTRSNTDTGPVTDSTSFTVTVTGPGIQQTIDAELTWDSTEKNPTITISSSTDGTAGSADGLKYIRLIYPKRRGSGEPWAVDVAASNGSEREVTITPGHASAEVEYLSTLTFPIWQADYNTTVLEIPGPPETGGGGGDYTLLDNKPSINGVTLVGNKTFPQLDLLRITNQELEEILI